MTIHRPPPLLRRGPSPILPWLVAGAALAAVLFPLATYATTLALFGPAHVVAELRYLRLRFGRWLARHLGPVYALLAGVAAVRLATVLDVVDRGFAYQAELALGALLVLAVWRLAATQVASALASVALAAALVGGLLWAPVPTLLAVAVLHNWTPVPLIAEALGAEDRVRWRAPAVLAFMLVPALIATGWPWAALHALGDPEWTALPAGPLAKAYAAYLPSDVREWGSAQHLFSAVVFAQCLHYVTVLGVLPRFGVAPQRIGWPVLVGTLALLGLYTVNFAVGRSVYGIFAAVHAWVEVPILVLTLLPQASRSTISSGPS